MSHFHAVVEVDGSLVYCGRGPNASAAAAIMLTAGTLFGEGETEGEALRDAWRRASDERIRLYKLRQRCQDRQGTLHSIEGVTV
jgi:hypothetical protein